MSTWYVVPSPNPLNSSEVGSLDQAAGSAAPGDTVIVSSGSWGGAPLFKSGVQVIGAGKESTIFTGALSFASGSTPSLVTKITCLGACSFLTPMKLIDGIFAGVVSMLQGGDIIQCLFPPKSKLNYLGGTGVFKDSLIDSDFFIGAAFVTGDNVQTTGALGADYKAAPGASMQLSNSTFGGMAVDGLGTLAGGTSQAYIQSGGVSTVSGYRIENTVVIDSGKSTFENTTIGDSMIIKGSGSVTIKAAVSIGA